VGDRPPQNAGPIAAGQIAAAAAEHRFQHGEQRKHVIGDIAVLAF